MRNHAEVQTPGKQLGMGSPSCGLYCQDMGRGAECRRVCHSGQVLSKLVFCLAFGAAMLRLPNTSLTRLKSGQVEVESFAMAGTMSRALLGLALVAAPAASVAVPTVEIAEGVAWQHTLVQLGGLCFIEVGFRCKVHMPMIAFGSYRGSLTSCSVQEGIEQWLRLGGSLPQYLL